MVVKIQLLRDNGTVIKEDIVDACLPFRWQAYPFDGPIVDESGQRLHGYAYQPVVKEAADERPTLKDA